MAKRVAVDDLIDAQVVADILHLAHRNTVSQYQRRYEDMPSRPSTLAWVGSSSGFVPRLNAGRQHKQPAAELGPSAASFARSHHRQERAAGAPHPGPKDPSPYVCDSLIPRIVWLRSAAAGCRR